MSRDTDIDDLIGIDEPKKRGRPLTLTPQTNQGRPFGLSLDLGDVMAGVPVSWLAAIFRMGSNTVKMKLAKCPPLKAYRGGNLYDLRTAVSYLVPPQVDITEYVKNMRPSDLPPELQKDFWDAMLKKSKWEEEAGDLWRTSDVVDVLGDTFKNIKTTVQLWVDNLERVQGLTDEQRETLVTCTDGLLADIYNSLVDMPKHKKTQSSKSSLDHLVPKEVTKE